MAAAARSCSARAGAARRDRATRTTATTCSTRRRSPTPSTTACSASCRRSRPRIPSWRTPDSPTQRVGARAGRRSSRASRTACRCCRSTTPSTTRRSRRSTGACREALDVEAVEYSCEPKFDGLAISLALRGRRLRPGRHARRRRDRRGRDRQPAHHPRDSAAPARGQSRRELLEVRGEVLMYKRDFEALNARAARRRARRRS